MSEPIKVAFVVSSLGVGGAEKHTVQLFNHLPLTSFRPALAYLKRDERLLPEVDPTRGSVWCGDFGKGWDFSGLRRFARWLRKINPAVLVCVEPYPLFYGYLARRLGGQSCRILVILHSTNLPVSEHRKVSLVYRPVANRSDGVVYVCNAQRAHWEKRGLRSDLGHVIHNGVDTQQFVDNFSAEYKAAMREGFGFTKKDLVIGICAGLRPEKRHEDLIRAIACLNGEGLSCKSLIIGDGSRRQAIQEMISNLGLHPDVALVGFKRDVRPFVACCDCMALVSDQETFSIAALESMAMGKPMIMSLIGGAGEQVRHGKTGYLFPARNVAALKDALRKIADQTHALQLGHASRLYVERHFDADVMLAKYADLFRRQVRRLPPA